MRSSLIFTLLMSAIYGCSSGGSRDLGDVPFDAGSETAPDGTDDDRVSPDGVEGSDPITDVVTPDGETDMTRDVEPDRDGDRTETDWGWVEDAPEDELPCLPDCGGRECGADGCGGYCGTQPLGECEAPGAVCLSSGVCCVPYCWGAECGPDECGGFCGPTGDGSCPGPDETCANGKCCVPDCEGKECGDDDCGGECGVCATGTCYAGSCCTPNCFGKQCGDDGCGGFCGVLLGYCEWYSETCLDDGSCCLKDCWGKECGGDGCGGYCGLGGDGSCADPASTCVAGSCCKPSCESKSCGDDGCGGSCGECADGLCQDGQCVAACSNAFQCGESCCLTGLCYEQSCCVPDCAGKICGPDGCGGSCGACNGKDCWRGYTCSNEGMIEILAGEFFMGHNFDAPGVPPYSAMWSADELPKHSVATKSYSIDALETTIAAYVTYLNSAELVGPEPTCSYHDSDGPCFHSATLLSITWSVEGWAFQPGREQMPIYDVTWAGAGAYCSSQGKRLCTEAEWERAAGGGCDKYPQNCENAAPLFPWGNEAPGCDVAQGGCAAGVNEGYSPVGVHPDGHSVYGVEDLAGNVEEWVEDCYHVSYDGAPGDGSAWTCESLPGAPRVVRGGSADGDETYYRTSARQSMNIHGSAGIRCCRDLQ